MSTRRDPHESFGPDEDAEIEAARRDAAAIGGRAGDEDLDPALRPLVEGGEGEAEGFELAEEDLIEAARMETAPPIRWAMRSRRRSTDFDNVDSYGEADREDFGED